MKRRQFLIGAAAVGAGSIARPIRANAQGTKTVRIGMIQPMSGNYAAYGLEGQPAFDYVIKQINAEGGVKSLGGAQIEVVLADDGSQPSRSAAEARRLVTEEKVVMLSGSLLSNQMLAVAPVTDELKIPTMSIWAGGARADHMFSTGFPYDRGYAESFFQMTKFLVAEKGFAIKKVAMVYSNYEAGQQANKFLVEKLKAGGFEIAGDVPLDMKASDQGPAVLKLRTLKADAAIGLVTPRDGILLHRARYDLKYHDCLFIGGSGGYSDSSLWKDLGDAIGGEVLTRNLFGMTVSSNGAKTPAVKKIFADLEKADLKITIGQAAVHAAQAARVIHAALEAAGGTDTASIMKGFRTLEIPADSPHLYIGKPKGIKFGEDRQLIDGSALFIQWTKDKRQEVVFPAAFAGADPRLRS